MHRRRIEIKIRLSNEIGGSSGTHQLGRRRVGRDEQAFEDLRIQTVGKSLDDRPVDAVQGGRLLPFQLLRYCEDRNHGGNEQQQRKRATTDGMTTGH